MPTFATQSPSQIAAAAFINALSAAVDLLRADPTTPWAPVWHSATGDPAGVTPTGIYTVRGRLCTFHAEFVLGAGFSIGTGPYGLDIPVQAVAGFTQTVNVSATDTSAGAVYNGLGRIGSGGSTVSRIYFPQGATTPWGPTVPFTWANTDIFFVDGSYFTV